MPKEQNYLEMVPVLYFLYGIKLDVLHIKISPFCGIEVMVDVHGTLICNFADPEPEEFGLFLAKFRNSKVLIFLT